MTKTLVTRLGGVRVVLQRIPFGVGPECYLWVGELRSDDDHPWHHAIRVAPYTPRGLGLILASLQELAEGRATRRLDRRHAP